MHPRLSDLTVGHCTAPMLYLISPCGVVKTCNLMCASPFICLLKVCLCFRSPYLSITPQLHCTGMSIVEPGNKFVEGELNDSIHEHTTYPQQQLIE
jgi:hypothetical protein